MKSQTETFRNYVTVTRPFWAASEAAGMCLYTCWLCVGSQALAGSADVLPRQRSVRQYHQSAAWGLVTACN